MQLNERKEKRKKRLNSGTHKTPVCLSVLKSDSFHGEKAYSLKWGRQASHSECTDG